MEWRIPWDSTWDHAKKLAAAERLADYMRRGTLFEERTRMLVRDVEVVSVKVEKEAKPEDPYLRFILER